MRKKLLLLSSLLIFIGFLLPWISQPDYGRSANGFEALQMASNNIFLILVLLFPVCSLLIAYCAYVNELNSQRVRISKIVVIILSAIMLIAVIINMSDPSTHSGIGAFLTMLGGFGYFADFFVDHPNPTIQSIFKRADELTSGIGIPTASKENNKEIDFTEQLEKFFALKEKGVITEEEYNKEKAKLLGK